MKIKLKFIFILSVICLALSLANFCFAAPEDSKYEDIRTYTSQILHKEINKSIHDKFGTNWIFTPKKVCEINGENLMVEGNLSMERGEKRIRIELNKDDETKYRVLRITEL
ncbi:hypothetical protein [Paenibacillus sp. JZ16]|uniref:hypothetical protein n=1 Tax=Paenibacillus sp. JZ16 TaxID=1906272 RepID=UPI00188D2553|nr:hypothetical protein [Paenibacillus sp. JZ16]